MLSATIGNTVTALLSAIGRAGSSDFVEAFRDDQAGRGGHEFLFFLKPELFDGDDETRVARRLETVFDAIGRFDLRAERAIVLTGRYLGTHDIISEHYGVIDRIARNPEAAVPEEGRLRFAERFGMPFAEAQAVGSVGYLRMRPDLTPDALSREWLAAGYVKLSGGCYCRRLEDEEIYLFNGFYPKLLKHYTRRKARIVAIVLSGDLPWAKARREFAGATNPAEALPGSIRRTLLDLAEPLGLPEVSANLNGVHLSAGPLEAQVELGRFTAERTLHIGRLEASKAGPHGNGGTGRRYLDFRFGRALSERVSHDKIMWLLTNPDVPHEGLSRSVFDLTEELDADAALDLLSEVAAAHHEAGSGSSFS